MQMQAIVLAGGKGQRLWPLTESTPKAMALVAGNPILYYHLQWLKKEGVTDIVLAAGYLGEMIHEYLLACAIIGLHIIFLREDHPLGRGGATRNAVNSLPYPDEPCIISQADTISDMPLKVAYQHHTNATIKSNILLTLLLVPYRSRHAVVEIEHTGIVARFREKPRLPYWTNTGIFVASPKFFEYLPEEGDEDVAIEQLVAERRVTSFCTNSYYRTLDTLKDIKEVEIDITLPALPHDEIF